jgi:SH3-like domain-containing protein
MTANQSTSRRCSRPLVSAGGRVIALLSAMLAFVFLSAEPGADRTVRGAGAQAAEGAAQTGPSGLPLPRFVSLRADRVNVRAGPGRDHRVTWTFAREGLPVEIVAEFDNWRRIRDSDGAEGWVFHSLLSGRRTGVVAPWSREDVLALRRSDSESAAAAAYVEPGVLVDLMACDGTWCRVSVQSVTGWMPQEQLWGVYPREVVR